MHFRPFIDHVWISAKNYFQTFLAFRQYIKTQNSCEDISSLLFLFLIDCLFRFRNNKIHGVGPDIYSQNNEILAII